MINMLLLLLVAICVAIILNLRKQIRETKQDVKMMEIPYLKRSMTADSAAHCMSELGRQQYLAKEGMLNKKMEDK